MSGICFYLLFFIVVYFFSHCCLVLILDVYQAKLRAILFSSFTAKIYFRLHCWGRLVLFG